MFLPDAIHLRQFYSSPLGRRVIADVSGAIRRFWPRGGRDTIAGLGFALPFLTRFFEGETQLLSLMPRDQGAIYWPSDGDNLCLLVDPAALPVGDNLVNRVLAIHALEHSQHAASMLREIWRILVPGGRALLIVPNRRGLWAQAAGTPFGCGQPFTAQQLRHRASLVGFTFVEATSVAYTPPVEWRWVLALGPAIELLGRMFAPGAGGILVVEVEKQIYASIPEPVRAPIKSLLYPAGEAVPT